MPESSFVTVVTVVTAVTIAASLSMACALPGDDDGSTDESGEAEPSAKAESADSVSPGPPLRQFVIPGPCIGTSPWSKVGFKSVDPADFIASTESRGSTTSGNIVTYTYREKSSDQVRRYWGCVSGRLYERWERNTLVHRDVSYLSVQTNGGIFPLGVNKSRWSSGW